MSAPFTKLAEQHRRVGQAERLLQELTQAQNRLRSVRSPFAAELLRVNIETSTNIAHSLDLALEFLESERQAVRTAVRAAMIRHGIPV